MTPESDSVQKLKQAAAESAAALIDDGMIVGLGSGSTATLLVAAIGKRVLKGLRLTGVPTSEQTAAQARELNIPLSTLGDHPRLDMAIDGADEVELGTLNLSKGGGGNQTREKLVAVATSRLIIVVDERKLVNRLGMRSPVSVEVIPFGWQSTAERLRATGATPVLRHRASGDIFITDSGNYILDCSYEEIAAPSELAVRLDSITGVVEHGLFIDMTEQVIVGGGGGIKVLQRSPTKGI